MTTYKANITVRLKDGVLDPQGAAIMNALSAMGHNGVESVRQGKVFDVSVEANDEAAAREKLTAMSEKLLANTVIEDFEVDLVA